MRLVLLNLRHEPRYGAGEKSRTPDLRITNALLYQLSYAGVRGRQCPTPGESRILAEPAHWSSKASSRLATAAFFKVAYTGRPLR